MDQPIEFAKLSGSGNDFICIDNRDGRFDRVLTSPVSAHHFARTLCSRGTGIGADGVVFAYNTEAPKTTDIAVRFFEADGAEAAFCGNGSACFTHWVVSNGIVPRREVNTLTPAGIVTGRNGDDSYVRVCTPLPQDLHRGMDVPVDGADLKCDFVVVGVRHVITYVDDIEKVDVAHLGPALRHHELFQPEGANASFVQVLSEGKLALRTYESGVEGETLACGTGSAAAATLVTHRLGWSRKFSSGEEPVLVRAHGGDILKVFFTMEDDGTVTDLCLETIVRFVCTGTVHPDLAARAFEKVEGAR